MAQNETPLTTEVLRPIRRTIIILVVRLALILFLFDSLYAVLLMASAAGYIPTEWTIYYATYLWIIYTAKYFLLTYLILKMVIDWTSTLYYVTGDHLIRQRGVLHITETVFQLTDIESVVMNQSWIGRLLNFGDVIVGLSIARQIEFVNLYAIDSPQRYKELFSEFV